MKKFIFCFLLTCTCFPLLVQAQKKKEMVIAFGSCNRQNLPQPMWSAIMNDKPNLWIWLGDNIYGDSDDMAFLKGKYDM
ncbi:hypothetical protein ACMA1I_11470 [Pontibacter sp. 13R65]|uniref:hypothetical protein n=1 Tax=Pontibacter sp. 13R65 TaxID=3127458 RepID=UPI00301DBBDB